MKKGTTHEIFKRSYIDITDKEWTYFDEVFPVLSITKEHNIKNPKELSFLKEDPKRTIIRLQVELPYKSLLFGTFGFRHSYEKHYNLILPTVFERIRLTAVNFVRDAGFFNDLATLYFYMYNIDFYNSEKSLIKDHLYLSYTGRYTNENPPFNNDSNKNTH